MTCASTYILRNDSECEGIKSMRYSLGDTSGKIVCGQKPDGIIQPILDLSNSTHYLFNMTTDEYSNDNEYDSMGISLPHVLEDIDPMYLEFGKSSTSEAKRESDCVRVQRHDKWQHGCVQFIADVGAPVLADWISRLADMLLKVATNGKQWTTTVYQHGLYFEINQYQDTTQEHKTLESAIDEFFRQHKWICYSYCLKFKHGTGKWAAYIKMYREGEDTAKTSFQCDSANHFSPGCDYVPNGDRAGQLL